MPFTGPKSRALTSTGRLSKLALTMFVSIARYPRAAHMAASMAFMANCFVFIIKTPFMAVLPQKEFSLSRGSGSGYGTADRSFVYRRPPIL